MRIKSLLITAVLTTAILFSASGVGAVTIQELMNQIAKLQAQLQALQAQQGTTPSAVWCHTFNANIGMGQKTGNKEVDSLVIALQKEGILEEGTNSEGYDEVLASAVTEFQEKYASEILTPYRLKHGTGFVGLGTRKKLNALYGCGVNPTTQLAITSISPESGPIGTVVSLMGNFPTWQKIGSDKVSYTVLFNNSNSWIATSGIPSIGSKEISFSLPASMKTNCTGSSGICPSSDLSVTPGVYSVLVIDSQTGATSNKVNFTVTSTTTPSITVTSPNGGEAWTQGSVKTITWTTNNIPASNNMTARLRDESGSEHYFYGSSTISNTVPNNGFFSVTVPSTLSAGKYKAEVKTAVGEQSYLDASDNYFTIAAATTAQVCTDSDNGKEYFVKGNTVVKKNGVIMSGKNATDYCNNSSYLTEYSCTSDGTDSIGTGYACSNGCLDGACKQATTPVAACTDSDYSDSDGGYLSGSDIYTKGYVTYTNNPGLIVPDGAVEDYCYSSSTLAEYRCHTVGNDNLQDMNLVSCANGCLNGACVQSTAPSITPSTTPFITLTSPNGGESWQAGETRDITWTSNGVTKVNISIYDYEKSISCRFNSEGITNINKYSWKIERTERCPLYVSNKLKMSVSADTTTTTGAVITDESNDYFRILPAPTPTCTDSDQGDYNVKGTAVQRNINGSEDSSDDTCIDSNSLMEYRCTTANEYIIGSSYYCSSGCQDGACKPNPINVTYPNGGETLEKSKTYTLRWNPGSFAADSSIKLELDSWGVKTLIATTTNTGTYEWTVPTTIPVGSYYVLRITQGDIATATYYNGRIDTSYAYFRIIEPTTAVNYSQDNLASIADIIAKIAQSVQGLLNR